MNQAIKNKWVKALLSGKYKQCSDNLYDKSTGGYCCLGVLHKIVLQTEVPRSWEVSFLNSPPYLEWGLDRSQTNELAMVNDAGVPFEMIAGLIDEAL